MPDDLLEGRRHSGGKAPVEFDPKTIEKLAALGCTFKEVAYFLNCSERTVERRLKTPDDSEEPSPLWEAWTFGKSQLVTSLRRQQMKVAFGNSKSATHMLIHMSKHQLGESDKALLAAKNDGKGGVTFIIEQ